MSQNVHTGEPHRGDFAINARLLRITLMAIVLDRLSRTIAQRRPSHSVAMAGWRRHPSLCGIRAIVALLTPNTRAKWRTLSPFARSRATNAR